MSILGEPSEYVVEILHNSCILDIFDTVHEDVSGVIIIGDNKILVSVEGHNREGDGRIRVTCAGLLVS